MTGMGSIASTLARSDERHRPGQQMKAVETAAGDALGMSRQDVHKALREGSSLADLAQAHGVSRDDLVARVAAALSDSATDATTALAGTLVDRVRPAHRHHAEEVSVPPADAPPPPPPAQPTAATPTGGVSFTLPPQTSDATYV